MKKHEPRPTLYNERHPLRLVAELAVAFTLFAYPVYTVIHATTKNLPRSGNENRLVELAYNPKH